MTNRKLTMGFPTSYRWSPYVTSKSPKGWLKKRNFWGFFGIKVNFNGIKSATKFLYMKTSSAKVVQQSICYEITKNMGWEVFPST